MCKPARENQFLLGFASGVPVVSQAFGGIQKLFTALQNAKQWVDRRRQVPYLNHVVSTKIGDLFRVVVRVRSPLWQLKIFNPHTKPSAKEIEPSLGSKARELIWKAEKGGFGEGY